jgi:hypothetical protein
MINDAVVSFFEWVGSVVIKTWNAFNLAITMVLRVSLILGLFYVSNFTFTHILGPELESVNILLSFITSAYIFHTN